MDERTEGHEDARRGAGAMPPVVKYTLGRVGLFVAVAVVLGVLPLPIDFLVKMMIALIVSFGLQFVVLRKWRTEMIDHVDHSVARRRAAREKLRSALAGDDAGDVDSRS